MPYFHGRYISKTAKTHGSPPPSIMIRRLPQRGKQPLIFARPAFRSSGKSSQGREPKSKSESVNQVIDDQVSPGRETGLGTGAGCFPMPGNICAAPGAPNGIHPATKPRISRRKRSTIAWFSGARLRNRNSRVVTLRRGMLRVETREETIL